MVTSRLAMTDWSCPYCESTHSRVMQRKRLILDLRRCVRCGLMFRWPKDSVQHNYHFYQSAYRQSMTPEMPEQAWLRVNPETLFRNNQLNILNISERLALLRTLLPWGRVLDYGSSWGYGTYQLRAAGYDAVGFEISRPRAELARKHLGVPTITEAQELDDQRNAFDAIFASNVLEHLPSLRGIFERFISMLKPGGVLLIFVPNCGGLNARTLGVRWGPMCCEEHPIAFDGGFFVRNLPLQGFDVLSFSDPYSPELWRRLLSGELECGSDGDDLVVCAWKRPHSTATRPETGQFLSAASS